MDGIGLALLLGSSWVPVRALPSDPAARSQSSGDLQSAIDAAVERGVDYLLSAQRYDGSWAYGSSRFATGQTALCVHALLACGLPPEHQAIQRALLRLEEQPPNETYSLACRILALEATHDERWHARIAELAATLVDWQDGTWSYPWGQANLGWDDRFGRPDLSNTQYAALALRAAQKTGFAVPRKVWNQLLRETLHYQCEAVQVGLPRRAAAGFRYRVDSDEGPTSSMTAAGIGVLAICREGLGRRLSASQERAIDEATELALAWLDENFDPRRNIGQADGKWRYYWLYGLERVGSLLGIERVGSHDWYAEGARALLAAQEVDGSWNERHPEPDTCFALLFLERATAARSGEVDDAVWLAASPEMPVRLRGSGQSPLTLWIDGLDDGARAELAAEPAGARLEYTVDGQVAETVSLRAADLESNRRWAVQHVFPGNGTFHVAARFVCAGGRVFESPTHALRVDTVLEPWMRQAATARNRNLLVGVELTEIEASSRSSRGEGPQQAVDGLEGTRWMAMPDDEEPWIRLGWRRAIKADRIVLGPTGRQPAARGRYDRPTRVEVRLDRARKPWVVDLDPDALEPTVVRLDKPRSVRRIEVRILARRPAARAVPWEPGQKQPGKLMYLAKPGVGFSEIALELGRE